ncbi:MAG: GIY-YIG nuclease family protein [Chloroflexi bacterium]|nr:GIY-YIG nuclease family protein [Chloroflexota bacterium]
MTLVQMIEGPEVGLLSPLTKPAGGGAYGLYCEVTCKWYVGASKQIERRFGDHERELNLDAESYRHYGQKWGFKYKGLMGRDYALYGPNSFLFVVLEEVGDPDRLAAVEAKWVAMLGALTAGYNRQPTTGHRLWS